MGAILLSVIAFVEANPAIVALGSEAVQSAISFVKSVFAAHAAGVLTDEQIATAWAMVTAGVQDADKELTLAIADYRARHPVAPVA